MLKLIFKYLNLEIDRKYLVPIDNFHSLSKVLKYHNVRAIVVSIPDIFSATLIFPAIIQDKNKKLYFLEGKDAHSFKIFNIEKSRHYKITFEKFITKFNSDILLFEKTDKLEYLKKEHLKFDCLYLFNKISLSFTVLIIFFFSIIFFYNISCTLFCLYLLNVAGLIISGAYLLNEYGITNIVFNNICKVSKNKDTCKTPNNFSKLPLSFSQLGVIYFIFNLIGFVLIRISGSMLLFTLLHFYFVILIIFMVIYSMYTQLIKSKSICNHCMVINTILILNTYLICTNVLFISTDFIINLGHIISGFAAYGLVLIFSSNINLVKENNKFVIKDNQIW
jgi:hypothetical protein